MPPRTQCTTTVTQVLYVYPYTDRIGPGYALAGGGKLATTAGPSAPAYGSVVIAGGIAFGDHSANQSLME